MCKRSSCAATQKYSALQGGRLWHLASDDSSYVFLRESRDEKLIIAFNDGASSKTISVSLQDTPAGAPASISTIFGDAKVDLAAQQLKLILPPQSLWIFFFEVKSASRKLPRAGASQ